MGKGSAEEQEEEYQKRREELAKQAAEGVEIPNTPEGA